MLKSDDLERNKAEISRLLKREIIYRFYFDTGVIKQGLSGDTELREAYRLLNEPSTIRRMLSGGYRPL